MMTKNYRTQLVGVFGHPIDENPTIVMQEAAFELLNLNFRYQNFDVCPEDLGAAVQSLKVLHMRGVNLTIPHKVAVLPHLDEISPDAKLIGAVNTILVREDGTLFGENTDGKGFLQSLADGAVPVRGKHALILGAGGAARAIAVELALAGIGEITVVNRSSERGHELCELVREKTGVNTSVFLWNERYSISESVDIVVNATSIGLFPNVDECPDVDMETILPNMTVCDVIPNHPQTVLLKEARKRGAKTIDGLSMLVNQGAIGFKLWTGIDAPVEIMQKALEEEFGASV